MLALTWLILLVNAVAAGAAADPSVWRRQVIYLVMPDRFHDGDPGNDRLRGGPGRDTCVGGAGADVTSDCE